MANKLKLFSQLSETKLMKKYIPLLLLTHVEVFANCGPKDLTDPSYLRSVGKENLISHFSKPRDQDSVGWCGAYATTDSLSFAVGEAVSAVDVSINQYANEGNTNKLQDLSGISVLSATDVAKTNGYCPESVIPSDQTSSSNLGHQAIQTLMTTFQQIADDYNSRGMPKDYCVTCAGSQFERVIKPTLPGVTSDMIREVLVANRGDSLKSLRALMHKLCEGKRKIAKPKTEFFHINGKNVAKVMDEALDNDSMPSIGMNTASFARDESVPGGHGGHEMMVVARRPGANGKCEYLIRNSWGRSCSFYKPHIAEKCDPAKGSFWMDSDQMQASVTDVVIVQNSAEQNSEKPVERTKEERSGGGNRAPVEDRTFGGNNNNGTTNTTTDGSNNNGGFNNPFSGMDFGGMLKSIFEGIGAAVSGIWQALSNMFKY